MSSNTFFNNFGAVIPAKEIASKEGLAFLSASTAMALAGRPAAEFVEFEGKPYLECFGGSLVAVDLALNDAGLKQRMYLPVMDRNTKTLAMAATALTDINNSRQRCLVKALAAVTGVGMSLYVGCEGDGVKAQKMLGVNPETDLTAVNPVVATLAEGGQPYIEWGIGLSAARIVDDSFFWEVVLWGGMPFRSVLGSVMVDVDTVYRGKRQRISLPIMDAQFDPVPEDKATVFDWNKTVMRALTKCIAFNTGYGLAVYGDDFGGVKAAEAKKADKPASTTKKADASASKASAKAAETKPVEAKPAAQPEANAEVKAEPAPQAAPAAEAEASAEDSAEKAVAEAVDRFKTVMQKRRESHGVPGLLSLFDALTKSEKFDEAHKPACFAVLVSAVAAVAEGDDALGLVQALEAYGAIQHLDAATRGMVATRVVTSALQAALRSDDLLAKAPAQLIAAGLAANEEDVVRLAKAGGIAPETLDLLKAVSAS